MEMHRQEHMADEHRTAAGFETELISIHDMYRNDMNFYSLEEIERLADEILLFGLKQNLEVVHAPCEKGAYRIIAGERRWLALCQLSERGYTEFNLVTCKVSKDLDTDEEQIAIIIANSYRDKSDLDLLEEEKRLKLSLENLKAKGKTVNGYDLSSGKLRDVIAGILGRSATKVGQIETINNRLIPELKEKIGKDEGLSFSAAYEIAGLPENKQKKMLAAFEEKRKVSVEDAKKMKKDVLPVSVSDTGTEEKIDSMDETTEPTGWTGSSKDNGSHQTEEQRYAKEQEKIDRDTAKRLLMQEQEKAMQNLPSDQNGGIKRKEHEIHVGITNFEDFLNGTRTFDLRKNEGFLTGDSLKMMEYSYGEPTGRFFRAVVTYLLEEYNGLTEGYCIMSIRITETNLQK